MLKLIQMGLVTVVMALSCVPIWAGSVEDYNRAVQYHNAGNYSAALKWYRQSAEQGYAEAQFNLGIMYNKGLGGRQDYGAALKWYCQSAEQGNAEAQSNLGLMYAKGHGVSQDYVTAHMWFNLAASNGQKGGTKNRDIVAKLMTATDLSEAQRRTRVCLGSNYQNCD